MLLNFNGGLRQEDELLLRADNRGFRYGDGVFETMLYRRGQVRLGMYHLERLEAALRLLRLELPQAFTPTGLEAQLGELCAQNGLTTDCRARLTVFRAAAGGFSDPDQRAAYVLQTSSLGAGGDGGLSMGLFPDGRKSCDALSGFKSNNYLLSSLAGMYAAERGWNDCLLLNAFGRVAETAAANIWWVRGGCCYTPPLTEGCVAGVMRRFLLQALPAAGYPVQEEAAQPGDLVGADEIFLSNAIRGVRGVAFFDGRRYGVERASTIQREIIQSL